MEYKTIQELVNLAVKKNVRISDIILDDQSASLEETKEKCFDRMKEHLNVMLDSIEKGTNPDIRSTSGLTGGDAYKIYERSENGTALCGPLLANGIRMAMAVSELNASMGKIVAAPTAGSCGILPGAIGAVLKTKDVKKEDAVMSLFTAGAIGMVIANSASISGAEGGCQAECGSASAMAAGAVVELCGGNPEMVSNAAAIAIKCILGLVCDPVAGLVEVPCVKRNASGVSLAFTAAELALAGIKSVIPVDEVILTMKKVGDSMPASLRETAEGGLACSPTGKMLQKKIFGIK
ncbi:L-serine ammonia-lyase, iron-sulfur-dependent, subunit alpha [Treponema pedis]|uniref:L-serine dehydratase n=2 Tax=Treponema pedis TaxID=409322 RepID=S5ZJJ8_9SPIR|nr:L-serine ammonia-lyase, iron-sulfur-dependent, subunit alpha [Treponema pedis]AGT42717.1 L-serine dehydratase, iron-sulfur-dependent subunit alpha [Treponema pedis str. T A4]QOW61732.1 L-serine ammonia-lyase, iron-sulfur-dependent, subunit alpha [Treponema pedis]QSI03600.1 L-serine ammonia-lyase, iron-sulfur-dependent, subunit alpha [Treponema pedis]